MRVIRFDDREQFACRVMPLLLRDEAANCFFIGFIPTLPEKPHDVLLIAVEDDAAEIVAVGVMSPRRHLALSSASPLAIDASGDYLLDHDIHPPGVQTRPELARRFAQRYTARTGSAT